MHRIKLPGARFCVPLYPVCAQNKCLISNTALTETPGGRSVHWGHLTSPYRDPWWEVCTLGAPHFPLQRPLVGGPYTGGTSLPLTETPGGRSAHWGHLTSPYRDPRWEVRTLGAPHFPLQRPPVGGLYTGGTSLPVTETLVGGLNTGGTSLPLTETPGERSVHWGHLTSPYRDPWWEVRTLGAPHFPLQRPLVGGLYTGGTSLPLTETPGGRSAHWGHLTSPYRDPRWEVRTLGAPHFPLQRPPVGGLYTGGTSLPVTETLVGGLNTGGTSLPLTETPGERSVHWGHLTSPYRDPWWEVRTLGAPHFPLQRPLVGGLYTGGTSLPLTETPGERSMFPGAPHVPCIRDKLHLGPLLVNDYTDG